LFVDIVAVLCSATAI